MLVKLQASYQLYGKKELAHRFYPNLQNAQKQLPEGGVQKSLKKSLEIFAKFTGKHLRWSLFFNKVAGLRPGTLFKRLQQRVFLTNFVKLFRTPSVAPCEHLFFRTDLFGGCFSKNIIVPQIQKYSSHCILKATYFLIIFLTRF